MTQQKFVDFKGRLIRAIARKVLFIVDNLKVHHGKIVSGWLSEHKEEIELFFIAEVIIKRKGLEKVLWFYVLHMLHARFEDAAWR